MIQKDDILKLREETGHSLMECKKALCSTDGDINKAIELLKNYQQHVMVYHLPIGDVDDNI